jgi:hypothetical protein
MKRGAAAFLRTPLRAESLLKFVRESNCMWHATG